MDRRNGGDPLAPPRPPKQLPRVHRPRAPEPTIMSAPLTPRNLNQNVSQSLLQQSIPPTTAPLAPLQSSVTTFSRRRPPPPLALQQQIPSLSSNIHNLLEPPVSPVTLAAPRPDSERLANEYVDTPFRSPHPASRTFQLSSTSGSTTSAHVTSTGSPKPIVPPSSTATTTSATTTRTARRPTALPVTSVVTKQPVSYTKELPSSALHEDVDIHPSNGDSINSITCPQCKRCRCEECQKPRQLPSRWVCDNTCLCSAETVIDYASCLCCVKALYYHCSKDHEMDRDGDSISCADDPCSCLPHKRTTRWGCLGALSMALPCLLCYWPMQGCVALCANCYARHSRHGCRCPQSKTQTGRSISRTCDLTPEKRLLDSSPEF